MTNSNDPIDLQRIRASGAYLRSLAQAGVGIVELSEITGPAGQMNTGELSTRISGLKVGLVNEIPEEEICFCF